MFVTPGFRYLEVLFHIFCYYWGKENRSLYRGRSSLRGRRLKAGKGKEVLGKGVSGARETRTKRFVVSRFHCILRLRLHFILSCVRFFSLLWRWKSVFCIGENTRPKVKLGQG